MRWSPRRLGLALLATASIFPGATLSYRPDGAAGVAEQNAAVLQPRQNQSGSTSAGTTTPPTSPDTTVRVTVTSTTTVGGQTSTTTIFTTVTSITVVTSTRFATATVTSSNVDTATSTAYVTVTNFAKRTLAPRRTIELLVDDVARPARALVFPRATAAAAPRHLALQKRATVFTTITQVATVTSDVVATKTNVVVQPQLSVTTLTSTITSVVYVDAKTTVVVTSTLTVTSTSMTTNGPPVTYTNTQDLPPDVASSLPASSSTDPAPAPAPAGGENSGLSTGAKAGIGAGAGIAGIGIIALIAALVIRRRRQQKRKSFGPVDYASGLSAYHDGGDGGIGRLQPTIPNLEGPAMAGVGAAAVAPTMRRPIPQRDSHYFDPNKLNPDSPPLGVVGAQHQQHQRGWSDTSELDGSSTAVGAASAGKWSPKHSPGPSVASELDSSTVGAGGRRSHRHTMSSGMSDYGSGGGGQPGMGRAGSPPVDPRAAGGYGSTSPAQLDPSTVYYEMPEQRYT